MRSRHMTSLFALALFITPATVFAVKVGDKSDDKENGGSKGGRNVTRTAPEGEQQGRGSTSTEILPEGFELLEPEDYAEKERPSSYLNSVGSRSKKQIDFDTKEEKKREAEELQVFKQRYKNAQASSSFMRKSFISSPKVTSIRQQQKKYQQKIAALQLQEQKLALEHFQQRERTNRIALDKKKRQKKMREEARLLEIRQQAEKEEQQRLLEVKKAKTSPKKGFWQFLKFSGPSPEEKENHLLSHYRRVIGEVPKNSTSPGHIKLFLTKKTPFPNWPSEVQSYAFLHNIPVLAEQAKELLPVYLKEGKPFLDWSIPIKVHFLQNKKDFTKYEGFDTVEVR